MKIDSLLVGWGDYIAGQEVRPQNGDIALFRQHWMVRGRSLHSGDYGQPMNYGVVIDKDATSAFGHKGLLVQIIEDAFPVKAMVFDDDVVLVFPQELNLEK